MDKHKILYNRQFGFRKKHSTVHPILHLLNDISAANDQQSKDITLAVFLDLSKAFDTIKHETLLYKLDRYGIRGIANKWFKSYLDNRMQYLDFKGSKSDLANITCGVPQGSILGPILFLIYINDINASTKLNLLSFADDTTVYTSSASVTTLIKKTNTELKLLYDWLCANKLSLNIKKTTFSLFWPKTQNIKIKNQSIQMNGISLLRSAENKHNTKFLGVCLDESLSWKSHVKFLAGKLSSSVYIINKVWMESLFSVFKRIN